MKKKSILLVVLLITIGFAAVSTTLIMNGVINIASNPDDFDIYFSKAILDNVDVSDTTISSDKKTINFSTKSLKNVGNTSVLEYEVTNNSTQYDASVQVNCIPNSGDYFTLTNSLKETIIAGTSENGKVTVELTKASISEQTINFTCTIDVTATERTSAAEPIVNTYTDPILNGTDPVLKENLIPITLANDGTVTYASEEAEWYNYSDKKWANSVILIDNPSTVYNVGDTIKESDIESYFVWVPRYKYKIFNEGNYTTYTGTTNVTGSAQTIEIVFESKEVPASTGSKVGDYLTHPAFTNFDVNGIWVGKYETGYQGATTTATAQVDSAESNKIIVKPNVYSWRNVTVSNIFKAAYNYERNLDSHMMKNTEWGAVAYLSHSIYGINKEINVNNNSAYLTGYSAVEGTNQSTYPGTYGTDASKTLPYNTSTGYKASTTGNITGVYDMSGGVHEYLAGYNSNNLGQSGFTAVEVSNYTKYFDSYNINTAASSYNYRILGDATGEMGPFNYFKDGDNVLRYHNSWYSNLSYFVQPAYPWFGRGGHYDGGVLAGQFYFDRSSGQSHIHIGSRLVLAP